MDIENDDDDDVSGRESKKTKLKGLCRTRWVERHDAFNLFIELFPKVTIVIYNYCVSLSLIKKCIIHIECSSPNTHQPGIRLQSDTTHDASNTSGCPHKI